MSSLLAFAANLFWTARYALSGLRDGLAGRTRLRIARTVLIGASDIDVWRFVTAARIVFDGPPVVEVIEEPLAGSPDLIVSRTLVDGVEVGRMVLRELEHDGERAVRRLETVAHPLAMPPDRTGGALMGLHVAATPAGTALTLAQKVEAPLLSQRIGYRNDLRLLAARIKAQCEKDAEEARRRHVHAAGHAVPVGAGPLSERAKGHLLSLLAVASFVHLWGWQDGLLIACIVLVHELGHAAAMRMLGMRVTGVYLVPFFGGLAVTRDSYQTQSRLGFVALMGAGFSIILTLATLGAYWLTGDARLLKAAMFCGAVNAFNLLPIYPLDGGLILGTLLDRFTRHAGKIQGVIGVAASVAFGLYLNAPVLAVFMALLSVHSFLNKSPSHLQRLSLSGAAVLVIATAATAAIHAGGALYAREERGEASQRRYVDTLIGKTGAVPQCQPLTTSDALLPRLFGMLHLVGENAVIRVLSTAQRAGHGDAVTRWLTDDKNTRKDPRLARWLQLASWGTMAEIEAELAGPAQKWGRLEPRLALALALLTHRRFDDAFALFPSAASPEERRFWLDLAFIEILGAASESEALKLMERFRPHVTQTELAVYFANISRSRLSFERDPGERAAITAHLRQELSRLTSAPEAAQPAAKAFLDARGELIGALARHGEVAPDLPPELREAPEYRAYSLAAVAAGWSERGEDAKTRALREHVARLPWPRPEGTGQRYDEWEIEFEEAEAVARFSLLLLRKDVAGAEQQAKDIFLRQSPSRGAGLMIAHLLLEGRWQEADDWRERWKERYNPYAGNVRTLVGDPLGDYYQLERANAAGMRGAPDVMRRALEDVVTATCTPAIPDNALQVHFLMRSYVLMAVAERRLPASTLTSTMPLSVSHASFGEE